MGFAKSFNDPKFCSGFPHIQFTENEIRNICCFTAKKNLVLFRLTFNVIANDLGGI
jgi:hypothetical protein